MKRRATKRTAALLTAGMVVLASAMPAFAASATGTSADKGSITVSGLENGVTVSAYQIAYADYDSNGNFIGYEMVTDSGWSIEENGSYAKDPTENDLSTLWEQVKNNNPSGSALSSNGTAVINNLPVGSYLLSVTGSESTVYALMIGSVSYTTENGAWATEGGTINAVSDDNVWAKSAKPGVEKEEVDADGHETHGDSAVVGETITFHITVENIPHYDGSYPEFEVIDHMSGLTITTDELNFIKVTVSDGTVLKADTDYVVKTISDGFDVSFVVNGAYTLNAYAGMSLVIEYRADVTEAAANENGVSDHYNEATLEFSTNSYVYGATGYDEGSGDTSHEYSFTVSLTKVGTDAADANGLAGAEFELRDSGGTVVDTVTSGSGGVFSFSDLKEGTYTLKETKAPDGYVLSQTEYKLTLAAEYNADGTLGSWSVTVVDDLGSVVGSASGTGTTDAAIVNTHIASGTLPSMGGRGTMLLVLAGCAVVACAAAGYAVVRRKEAA